MTWPLAFNLGTHVLGAENRFDQWTHLWTYDWVMDALLAGESPFYTERIFYPAGVSLTSHNIAWLNILLWIPLQAVTNPVFAYSFLFLLTYTFNGFCAYLLGRELTGSVPAGLIAGLVYGYWPYILSHHTHPNMSLAGWVPLILLFLHRTMSRPNKKDTALATLCLFLLGLTCWQLLVMGGVLIGLYVIVRLVADAQARSRLVVVQLAIVAGVAGTALAPLAYPLVRDQLTNEATEALLTDEHRTAQTDVLAYIHPSPYHPVWGEWAKTTVTHQSFFANRIFTPYVGLVPAGLVLLGISNIIKNHDEKSAGIWSSCACFLYSLRFS